MPGIYWQSILGIVGSAAAGYLLGNIQTAVIISKRVFHDDVRGHGSGNAGSTNMARVFGLKPGLFTFAGDCVKAVLAVLLGRWLLGTLGGYIAGFCAVLGHCYPALASFRGGKGVACSFAVVWMSFPLGALIASAAAALVMWRFKRVSLCSLVGIAAFLLAVVLLRSGEPALVALASLLVVIVYIRHIDNIRRLVKGEEKELFF